MAGNRVTPAMVESAMDSTIKRSRPEDAARYAEHKADMSPEMRLEMLEFARILAEEINMRLPG